MSALHRLLAIAGLVALGACGPSSSGGSPSGRPAPSPRGVVIRNTLATALLDGAGGTLTSEDGLLTITIPPGALPGPVDITLEQITNTAPAPLGSAYRLGPDGTLFDVPVTLTFTSSAGVDGVTVATQEGQGFWLRYDDAVSDPVGMTVSVTTTHAGDFALVTASPRDLCGTFSLTSTRERAFTATGTSTLNFAGEDAGGSYYLQWGAAMVASTTIVDGATTCTVAAPTLDLPANIAEASFATPRFWWGIDTWWDASCTDGVTTWNEMLVGLFDTVGVNYVGCTRSDLVTPTVDPAHLAGSSVIDCGASGTVTGTWDFAACAP